MPGTRKRPQQKDRAQILTTAQGLVTQNYERTLVQGSSIMIDGTVYYLSVGLRAGDLVTNVILHVATAGATLTLSKVGLYDKSGTRLVVSADQGTAWETSGMKTVALSSPYTVPSDDGFYVALVSKGTTLPTLSRSSGPSAGTIQVGSGMRALAMQTGQTDFPASASFAGTAPLSFWVGLS
jgi:hypothetical protein